jgi:hypothetical protein
MIFERLHGAVASFELCVVDGEVDVAVARAAQGDHPVWVALLELLPVLPPALHLPGAGAGQEVVAGEVVFTDAPAAQLTAIPRLYEPSRRVAPSASPPRSRSHLTACPSGQGGLSA